MVALALVAVMAGDAGRCSSAEEGNITGTEWVWPWEGLRGIQRVGPEADEVGEDDPE